MDLMVMVQKLHLQFGDVDIRWAFGLAPFAVQAQIERFDIAAARELFGGRAPRAQSQGVRAAPCAVLLVPVAMNEGHIVPVCSLTAHASAVAKFDGAGKTAFAIKFKLWARPSSCSRHRNASFSTGLGPSTTLPGFIMPLDRKPP